MSLSWPVIIADAGWVVAMLVDMIWVGKLGAASIAGMGIALVILMLATSAKIGLMVGAAVSL